jgi:oligopeptide/dipeptide ABC transporter ATP-binding protein
VKTVMELKDKSKRLEVIKGEPPNSMNPPDGCRFNPRCQFARDICRKEKPDYKKIEGSAGRWVRCYFPLE